MPCICVYLDVILSFCDKRTEDVFHGRASSRVRKLPKELIRIIQRKLDLINAATIVDDLKSPPGNRLKKLKGEWKDYHSIRVNDQWRITFKWAEPNALEVCITDYH